MKNPALFVIKGVFSIQDNVFYIQTHYDMLQNNIVENRNATKDYDTGLCI